MFSLSGILPAIKSLLPNLGGALPDIERVTRITEAMLKAGPALLDDIEADVVDVEVAIHDPLQLPAALAALKKTIADGRAAWPLVVAAAQSGTVAASEPPVDADHSADALNKAQLGQSGRVGAGRALLFAGLGLLGLAAAACQGGPDPLGSVAADPAGQFLVSELSGIKADAAGLVTKANAAVGITPAEAQKMCGYDNIAHTVVSWAIKLSPAPSSAVGADDAAYGAIQGVCGAMDGTAAPNASQTALLSSAWTAAQDALKAAGVSL